MQDACRRGEPHERGAAVRADGRTLGDPPLVGFLRGDFPAPVPLATGHSLATLSRNAAFAASSPAILVFMLIVYHIRYEYARGKMKKYNFLLAWCG